MIDKTCSFSYPGTWGHECGAVAVSYAVKASTNTTDGLFYGGRCAGHLEHKGGDNADVIRFEPIADQRNFWKR